MNDNFAPTAPELSRPVRVEDLKAQTFTLEIHPSDRELEKLRARLQVDGLEGLSAQTSLRLLQNGDVLLKAQFQARVRQTCVLTLEPVASEISSAFETTYSNTAEEDWGHGEEEFAALDEDTDPPEPIQDGMIDVGEAISEHLALEIDPFPRVKGATFDGYSTGNASVDEAAPAKKNPFAVLSKLKTAPESTE